MCEFCQFLANQMYINTSNCEKRHGFCYISAKQMYIYSTSHEKRCGFCEFSAKQTYIYTTNCNKGVSFADFHQSKCIFMQPNAKKARVLLIFDDIIGHVNNQQKKNHVFKKKNSIFLLKIFWQLVTEKEKKLIFSTYLRKFYLVHLF